MDELEAELQGANNKVCHTGHLLNQMTIKLSTSESTQQQMSFLNKQLLLLGEAHKLSMQELHHSGVDNTKEARMLQVSYGKEVETLRQSLLVQGQKLEAAQHRVGELETHLSKKEHLIVEQKKFLEDVKCQAKSELQASDSRHQAQRRITQLLQTELLQLYSRVEMEAPAGTAAGSPPGGRADTHTPTDSSVLVPDGPSKSQTHKEVSASRPPRDSPRGNGSTLSPGHPKASNSSKSAAVANSVNGSQELAPPLLVEPSPSCPHGDALAPLPAGDAPLTVGSYPSARSFLGMRARELFRNKSESQCDEEQPQPPRLAGLAHSLKTELEDARRMNDMKSQKDEPTGCDAVSLMFKDQLDYKTVHQILRNQFRVVLAFTPNTEERTLLHQKLAPGSAAMLDQQVYLVYQCKHEDDPGL
ncbi:hypothetical protein F2P81_015724 [Scophthalmus maximus]|uniref:Uncharacterized protein n=1 Tax=Scophthalmus maximus TaxID=52904 RepID=A0A6A4SF59_SCOMX|nr:hypothetical protein F2P81_015724 [Scophthalmus maximus]